MNEAGLGEISAVVYPNSVVGTFQQRRFRNWLVESLLLVLHCTGKPRSALEIRCSAKFLRDKNSVDWPLAIFAE